MCTVCQRCGQDFPDVDGTAVVKSLQGPLVKKCHTAIMYLGHHGASSGLRATCGQWMVDGTIDLHLDNRVPSKHQMPTVTKGWCLVPK